MSLESERKAGGSAFAAERRATGAGLEAERRTIGRQITEDLNRLVATPPPAKLLPVLEKRGALPAKTGKGTYDPKNAPARGGGIATPLTELAYSTEPDAKNREYWPTGTLSSDGLFMLPAIKVLHLIDADGEPLVINLAEPVPPPVTP